MGYQNPRGCCCEQCSQSLFSDAGDVTLDKYTFTGDADNWSAETGPIRLELNDGSGVTPAASARKRINAAMRGGTQNFSIQTRVYTLYNGVTFDGEQIGLFIANAFALWVDFNDNTLRFAPTDAVGTIDVGSNTLLFTYGYVPYGQSFQAKLFRNANLKWNIEIWSTADAGIGLHPEVILYDQEFPGMPLTGAFEFGMTATTGGGAWRNFIVSCSATIACAPCGDATPLEWTKTHDAIPELSSDPTDMGYLGRCNIVSGSTLDVAVTEVQIGESLGLPVMRDLVDQGLSFVLMLNRQASVGTEPNIYIAAEVLTLKENFIDNLTLCVAVWSIPKTEWCCYGVNELTLVSFTDPTFGGWSYDLNTGSPGAIRRVWLQNIATWPATITVEAVGPAADTPCTVDCLWVAELVGDVLTWDLRSSGVCPTGLTCVEPVFAPSREGQQAYTVCE